MTSVIGAHHFHKTNGSSVSAVNARVLTGSARDNNRARRPLNTGIWRRGIQVLIGKEEPSLKIIGQCPSTGTVVFYYSSWPTDIGG